ncbi:hypothetical protein [Deinococcus sp. Leaf326]|uniref:DUF7352 domain-containing protein n=1 Tax=Deinococcus sp. Leaf326 TaxID=1736338 RepID=UPI0006FD3BA4|nr:hypothetical protein [Deinococcus sp. Leaf326]KQQ99909.1 hypothetical protein ASF71_21880 [Deinococcus sp. Leaf326]
MTPDPHHIQKYQLLVESSLAIPLSPQAEVIFVSITGPQHTPTIWVRVDRADLTPRVQRAFVLVRNGMPFPSSAQYRGTIAGPFRGPDGNFATRHVVEWPR